MSLTPPNRPDPTTDPRLAAAGLTLRLNPTLDGGELMVQETSADTGMRYVTVPYRPAITSGDVVGYAIAAWLSEHGPRPEQQSPEERFTAAHRALTDALHEFYRTATDGGALLVDWVLVTAGHADLGDGTSLTTHHIFGPEGGAAYRSLGLLEYGSNFVKDALTAGTTTDP